MTSFIIMNISVAAWNFFAIFGTLLVSWFISKFCFKVIAPYSIAVILFSMLLAYIGIIPTS